jgi:hypothetical protein
MKGVSYYNNKTAEQNSTFFNDNVHLGEELSAVEAGLVVAVAQMLRERLVAREDAAANVAQDCKVEKTY